MTLLTSLVHPGTWQIFGTAPDSLRLEGVGTNSNILISSPIAESKVTDTTVGGSSLKPSKTPPAHKVHSIESKLSLFGGAGGRGTASLELGNNSVASIHTYKVKKHKITKGTLNV